jgi:hypothetical protein
VYAIALVVLMAMSAVTYSAEGPVFAALGGGVTVGPGPFSGFLMALVWGIGGGALGGSLSARRKTPTGPGDPGPAHVSTR